MSRLLRFLLIVLSIVGVLLVVAAITSKLYRIPSSSMEPTLHCPEGPGRAAWATRPIGSPSRRWSTRCETRRAKTSSRTSFRREPRGSAGRRKGRRSCTGSSACPGRASRSGTAWCSSTAAGSRSRTSKRLAVTVTPLRLRPVTKDAYYVLGDNRARSCDSRVWGLVARDRLIGPKIATYWPWDRISIR